jgi:hypothetical protein
MSKKVKEINEAFQLLSENFPNERLRIKMLDLGNEYPEYAADELLLLSEKILSQVSAYASTKIKRQFANKKNMIIFQILIMIYF